MTFIADRLKKIKPSMTVGINIKANALRAEGKDVLVLAAGEPDFDTPINIRKAASKAMDDGQTRYVPGKGTPALQKAIQSKFLKDNNLHYDLDEIIVGVGGKHIIYNAMMATINPNDEVIIPAPFWVSYPDIVLLAEGKPIIVQCPESQNFKITADQLEKNITDKTKWLMLNSPSNPTGSLYSREELKELAEVLLKYPKVLIMSDDIYEKVIYDNLKFSTIASVEPKLKDRCLTLNGVSKAYSMTGWRIGYAAGNKEVIKKMKTLQSQSTSCASSISQAAACAALSSECKELPAMTAEYKKRHDYVVGQLNKIPGVTCKETDGTFYVFPSFIKYIENSKTIGNDSDLALYLLNVAKVATVPGSAFGTKGHIRISIAIDISSLEEAMKRISESL